MTEDQDGGGDPDMPKTNDPWLIVTPAVPDTDGSRKPVAATPRVLVPVA